MEIRDHFIDFSDQKWSLTSIPRGLLAKPNVMKYLWNQSLRDQVHQDDLLLRTQLQAAVS